MSAFVNTVKELEQSFAKIINFVENLFYSYIPDAILFLSSGKIFPFPGYIQIHDYPSGKISMKLPAMEALEKADLLEKYARHAEFLYSSLGRNFYITELEGYAFWAKED